MYVWVYLCAICKGFHKKYVCMIFSRNMVKIYLKMCFGLLEIKSDKHRVVWPQYLSCLPMLSTLCYLHPLFILPLCCSTSLHATLLYILTLNTTWKTTHVSLWHGPYCCHTVLLPATPYTASQCRCLGDVYLTGVALGLRWWMRVGGICLLR